MSAREERRTKSKISHKASVSMRAGNACQPGPTQHFDCSTGQCIHGEQGSHLERVALGFLVRDVEAALVDLRRVCERGVLLFDTKLA
jgi:hypothetical protein